MISHSLKIKCQNFIHNPLVFQKSQHKFEKAMAKHQVKHRYARPYRPQTNGKIERFGAYGTKNVGSLKHSKTGKIMTVEMVYLCGDITTGEGTAALPEQPLISAYKPGKK